MSAVTLDAIRWGRAGNEGRMVVDPIVCADGFKVSVQASWGHYAHDAEGKRPNTANDDTVYPFRSFEVGYPSERPEPWHCTAWNEGYDSHDDHPVCDGWLARGDDGDGSSIFAFVPYDVIRALLDAHGSEVA